MFSEHFSEFLNLHQSFSCYKRLSEKAKKFDDDGNAIGEVKDSARMLAGMIKQVNQNIQKRYKIGKPNFLTVPKHQDFGKQKKKFFNSSK